MTLIKECNLAISGAVVMMLKGITVMWLSKIKERIEQIQKTFEGVVVDHFFRPNKNGE
jgi:hypothetical protein